MVAHREWLVAKGRALAARAVVVREATDVVRAEAVAGLLEAASLMAEHRELLAALAVNDESGSSTDEPPASTRSPNAGPLRACAVRAAPDALRAARVAV